MDSRRLSEIEARAKVLNMHASIAVLQALARQDIPDLIAEVRRLQKRLNASRRCTEIAAGIQDKALEEQ